MAGSDEFLHHVGELLAPLGRASMRRMFGGHGVYLDGLFMALIADDALYLKTDEVSQAAFDAESCAPFTFNKGGKTMTTHYRQAPDEALDAPHLMRPWARLAIEAALRAAAAKPKAKTAATKKTAARTKSARPVVRRKSRK